MYGKDSRHRRRSATVHAVSRLTCYRCFWPKAHCWCDSIQPFTTRTRIVLLMHPKEFKQEKAATGRLAHLCLTNSEIVTGVSFGRDDRVQELIHDAANKCVLLYPGAGALNLTAAQDTPERGNETSRPPAGGGFASIDDLWAETRERQLVVFVLDATWAVARKMLKLSPALQTLPRVMFTPSSPSRYRIKQQPAPGCLATIEAIHELFVALAAIGIDEYPDREQLLGIFARMQDFQIACARDPSRAGYRRSEYKLPIERKPCHGRSGKRRLRLFGLTAPAPDNSAFSRLG